MMELITVKIITTVKKNVLFKHLLSLFVVNTMLLSFSIMKSMGLNVFLEYLAEKSF